jgi:hypothetical protein
MMDPVVWVCASRDPGIDEMTNPMRMAKKKLLLARFIEFPPQKEKTSCLSLLCEKRVYQSIPISPKINIHFAGPN